MTIPPYQRYPVVADLLYPVQPNRLGGQSLLDGERVTRITLLAADGTGTEATQRLQPVAALMAIIPFD